MTVMSKSIPIEFYEETAREEGWLPVGEVTIEDLGDLDHDVAYSIVFHREPEFFNTELGEPASADSWQSLCEQQQIRIFGESWRIPSYLTDEAKVLAREFRLFVSDYNDGKHMTHDIGTVFRDPMYQGTFENIEVPDDAVMAIIFDGGPVAQILNLSYEDYKAHDAANEFFKKRGYWFEYHTHWWVWVYKN
jgi:hypothetical protein